MNYTIILIYGLVLMAVAILFAFAYGQNNTNSTTLDQMCFQMYHLDNWTLGLIKGLEVYCSNH